MGEFEGLRGEISSLRVAITGGMKPEDGLQYRIRELERNEELRQMQHKAKVESTEKKTDRNYLLWGPILLLILERAWSWFTGRHS